MADPPPRHRHGRQVSRRTYRWRRAGAAGVAAAVLAVMAVGIAKLVGSAPARSSTSTLAAGAPTTRAPVTTTTPAATPVSISMVGDSDLGNTPTLPPNPSTYLDPVVQALHAQVVFGNLEGTLTDATTSKCGAASTECFAFRNPPAYAQIYRSAGFTVLNSANNHSHDFGAQGVADTTAALQGAGIVQAGLPGQIGVVSAGGTKVAFVDFAPYPTTNNLLDLAAARSLIQRAKAEATVVVVYMHAGAEGTGADHVTGQTETYVGEDRGNPEVFAHAAIDDGAALVIASGPHVLRGMEYYGGHLIAYSLGNFVGYQNFSTSGTLDLSGILTVTLSGAGTLTSAHFTSLALSSVGEPNVDPSGASASFVNQLSNSDFGAAAATIQPGGLLTLPSVVPPAPGSATPAAGRVAAPKRPGPTTTTRG
jgi:poly-gamma-glutamate capsule biosynthesis protein CapA/YwtB (metallophosphatase superfamily)